MGRGNVRSEERGGYGSDHYQISVDIATNKLAYLNFNTMMLHRSISQTEMLDIEALDDTKQLEPASKAAQCTVCHSGWASGEEKQVMGHRSSVSLTSTSFVLLCLQLS
jgi:hypothetical protein